MDDYGKPFRGTPGKRPDGKVLNWCRAPPAIKHYECCECGHHVHRRSIPLGWTLADGSYTCPACMEHQDALTTPEGKTNE